MTDSWPLSASNTTAGFSSSFHVQDALSSLLGEVIREGAGDLLGKQFIAEILQMDLIAK